MAIMRPPFARRRIETADTPRPAPYHSHRPTARRARSTSSALHFSAPFGRTAEPTVSRKSGVGWAVKSCRGNENTAKRSLEGKTTSLRVSSASLLPRKVPRPPLPQLGGVSPSLILLRPMLHMRLYLKIFRKPGASCLVESQGCQGASRLPCPWRGEDAGRIGRGMSIGGA